jgi:predicted DCC family thiol-disulfide oxidoreductase YuxK
MIKVLFNDKCSICSTEINHYKSLNTNDIYWLDINDLDESMQLSGKTHKELLRRLHVMKDDKLYSGVKAFIVLWDRIPKYRWLSRVIALPLIYHISILAYELIAIVLYLKNYHQLNEKK